MNPIQTGKIGQTVELFKQRHDWPTYNSGFGNRLAEGIPIGCSSLSAVVPADEQKSAFSIYLQLWYFTGLTFRAEGILKTSPSPSPERCRQFFLTSFYRKKTIINMPFSDDEQILVEEKSKLKTIVLFVGIGLFVFSLFNISFCTDNGCRTSIETLLIGWLAMLTGGAAITWLANPFLVIAWVLLAKNKNSAWLFGLTALIFSISFLKFQIVIVNEAGHYNPITKVGLGHWLWLSSCLTTFIGILTIRILKYRNA
ncbi:MAG: hypothetical protein M3040_02470 [Bacteroidota bacterium]|nr:hypothetical protein [Bacteroidota bacterium]